jgi:hypothetical protein
MTARVDADQILPRGAQPSGRKRVVKNRTVRVDSHSEFTKGECEMKLPTTISGWCMWLFFLWFGLGAFVTLPMAAQIGGILALGYAVFALLGR